MQTSVDADCDRESDTFDCSSERLDADGNSRFGIDEGCDGTVDSNCGGTNRVDGQIVSGDDSDCDGVLDRDCAVSVMDQLGREVRSYRDTDCDGEPDLDCITRRP